MLQKLCYKKLGKHAYDDQRDAFEAGLEYTGHNHESAIETLFQINDEIKLFGENAEGFSMRDTARKIIPKTLKPVASLKFFDKGCDELRDKQDILDVLANITNYLKKDHEVSQNRNRNEGTSSNNNANR